jgi:LPXTG-motif cell wall-anchored protein
VTGPTPPPRTTLTTTGCFSYTESLAATVDSLAATSAPGLAAETALMLPPPTVVTAVAAAVVYPYSPVSDTVSVTGTDGQSGVVSWSLVGPVAAAGDGTCNGISFAGARVENSGLVTVTADGDLTAGPTDVDGIGCYSFTDAFTGPDFLGQTVVAAGATDEVVLVQPFQPVLTTHATDPASRFFDNVTVSGSGIGSAPEAPTSAVLTWTLLGPAVAADGGCAAVNWSGQAALATGTMVVTGDGTYVTPSTALDRPGCYTFYESLSATDESDAASTDPGVAVETHDVLTSDLDGDGLGSIGTDLGRWLPGHGVGSVPVAVTLGFVLLTGGGFVARRRRRRRA